VKFVIIGAGGMGGRWSEAVARTSGADLVGIVDPLVGTGHAADWIARTGAPAVPALEQLGAVAAEAAIVTAPSPVHAAVIRAALQRGLHVIVEKPFATDLGEARALVELAEQRGRTLMVSQNYRLQPGFASVRGLANDNAWGAVRSVVGAFWMGWEGKPYQHAMQHVMALEMAIHHYDMVRGMFDAEAVGGQVREWNPEGSPYADGGAVDALFDMRSARGHFSFLYSGSLVASAPTVPWTGNWRFVFDRAIFVADTIGGRYGLYAARPQGYEYIGAFWDEDRMTFEMELREFIDCVAGRRQPATSGRDNLGALAMALGFARRSGG
jgi:predicted dehydrogenase